MTACPGRDGTPAVRTRGSVLEPHAYALPPEADPDTQHKLLVDHLHRVYPETLAARIVGQRHEGLRVLRRAEAVPRPVRRRAGPTAS
ncbi:hypothetical protein ACH4L5_06450 [Streptomyces sp. NPDC017405]|uniref:hypothetical protein n=1 Tax=unclassified Streptomyces TaxID=2593676 RepID=UPI00378FA2CB